jgi:hypothetical protein
MHQIRSAVFGGAALEFAVNRLNAINSTLIECL